MAFEAFLTQDQDRSRPRRWRRLTYALSLALHAGLLLGAVGHSFWRVDELQPRRVSVHFLLSPAPAPPPPLPAAPVPLAIPIARKAPAPRVRSTAPLSQPPPPAAVEPVVATEPIAPAEPTADVPEGDLAATGPGDSAGVAGGDEGVIAAAPPPPPSPPVPPPAAINLAPQMGIQLRTTDLNDPRFRPTLPPALNRGGMVVVGLFRICVSPQGQVKDVSVLKSADPLVDQSWAAVIRTWEYRPYSVAGHAVAFCHAARIEVRAQS
jgi:hypothetical protein